MHRTDRDRRHRKDLVRAASTGLVALVAIFGRAPRADSAIVHTAPLESVATISSHVGLFDLVPATGRFRVVTWLRGAWPESEVKVYGLSSYVASRLARRERPQSVELSRGTVTLTGRVVLFLEELDGRLHHTGMRRRGGIGSAHASARFLSKEGIVLGLRQVRNPGGPMLVSEGAATEAELVERMRALLASNPYSPPPSKRPSVPPAYRATFFEALGNTVSWYQGDWPQELPGWSSSVGSAPDIAAAARRLRAWMLAVPREGRLAGLDALLLLARNVQGGGPDATPALAVAHELLGTVDTAAAAEWVLDEIRAGDYYVNRVALVRLAELLGRDVHEAALRLLEAAVERSNGGVGLASLWALRELGFGDRAEAADARREGRPR